MPADEDLVARVREALKRRHGVHEQRMFGGVAFMVNGNMACGVAKGDLVVRLGNENAARALSEPGTRPMDFTGRPLKSMVYVSAKTVRTDEVLKAWVDRAVVFARSLPAKL